MELRSFLQEEARTEVAGRASIASDSARADVLTNSGAEAGVTVDLAVHSAGVTGRVIIADAVVRHASFGAFSGEEALLRLWLARAAALPSTSSLAPDTPPVDLGRVVSVVARAQAAEQALASESARLGGLHAVLAVSAAGLKAVLQGIPADVARVVTLVDGTRDLAAVLALSPLSPAVTLRVLEKLRTAGALVDAAPAEVRAPAPASTLPSPAPASTTTSPAPASTLPSPASTTTSPASASTLPSPAPASTTTTSPAPASTTTTSPAPSTTTSPAPASTLSPAPASTLPSPAPASASTMTTSPAPSTTTSPEFSDWKRSETNFFESRGPEAARRWPLWFLLVLVLLGAVVGVALVGVVLR